MLHFQHRNRISPFSHTFFRGICAGGLALAVCISPVSGISTSNPAVPAVNPLAACAESGWKDAFHDSFLDMVKPLRFSDPLDPSGNPSDWIDQLDHDLDTQGVPTNLTPGEKAAVAAAALVQTALLKCESSPLNRSSRAKQEANLARILLGVM